MFMLVNLLMENFKVKVNMFGKMEIFIKDNIKMEKEMEWVYFKVKY